MGEIDELKIGDRIRILTLPKGCLDSDYVIAPETIRVYKKLIARKRSVRIYEIDEWGSPWYQCGFRKKNGKLEYHFMSIMDGDDNWVKVKMR